ncbi:MAG TPA: thioredoxin domain-containing protein [Terracidiphilus sp.]|nr:thioredoxin domain-containing protein [Terracidiphilus sp.]
MLRRIPFPCPSRSLRSYSGLLLGLAAILITVPAAHAQSGAPAALRPPAGAKVAIVEFDDMECPMCAETNPLLMQAQAKYRIPWIRHDFLIPGHPWSPTAAVYARWFDTRSKEIGSEYRNAVFANQPSIETRRDLFTFTQKFASSHKLQLPFMVDPENKLSAEVQDDVALGKRLGVFETPTIYIVMANPKGAPFIKVQNPRQDLFRDIDKAISETGR